MINLWWNNLSDAAANVFTPSTFQTGFPGSNVANSQPTVVWITGVTQANENLVIDFGSAISATDFICAAHNLTASDSAIRIQANSSNSFGAPPFDQALTWVAGPIQQSFSTQTYRYWNFKFTKSSSSVSRQIGRIFIGTKSTVNPPDFQAGVQCVRQDLSLVNTSRGGQDYGLLKPSKRLYKLTYTNAVDSDFSTLDTIYNTNGKVGKFWMQIDSNSGDPNINSIVYVRFNADPSTAQVNALDSSQCWDLAYELLEQI